MINILAEIKEAFDGVRLPPKEKLLNENVVDDLWIESFLGFEFLIWEEIPDSSIEHENLALTVLSPEAFLFFLPAYMTWAINFHITSDSTTADHTIYYLELNSGETARQLQLEQFEILTLKQKRSVLLFLKFMSTAQYTDNKIALQAIEKYWGKYDFST